MFTIRGAVMGSITLTKYTIDILIKILSKLLDAHRERVMTTCADSCMCWELDGLITGLEQKHSPKGADDE